MEVPVDVIALEELEVPTDVTVVVVVEELEVPVDVIVVEELEIPVDVLVAEELGVSVDVTVDVIVVEELGLPVEVKLVEGLGVPGDAIGVELGVPVGFSKTIAVPENPSPSIIPVLDIARSDVVWNDMPASTITENKISNSINV